MVIHIAKKEFLSSVRSKQLISISAIIILLLVIAATGGYLNYKVNKEQSEFAQREKRKEWLHQGKKNPHIASHFGTYVFKPKTGLSFFDFGLDTFTGSSIYLEAHYQHEFMFRPAQDYSSMIRFGELSIALVLQILMPLLIIFLSFAAITKEREDGTMKLIISQGISLKTLVWGKITAYSFIVMLLLIPTISILMFIIFLQPSLVFTPDLLVRILLLAVFYLIYFFTFTAFSVWISSIFKVSKNALLTLLFIWIVLVIIIPKTSANLADNMFPLPSMNNFKKLISEEVKDNPLKEKLINKAKNKLLAKYKVDSIKDLPVNFEGEYMQISEDFANQIHDRHSAKLLALLNKQNKVSTYVSLLNPYLAIRNISMALSGTDFTSNKDFQNKAEDYRREMVRKMNYDYRDNSKWGEFIEYGADIHLWSSLEDFNYKIPSVLSALKSTVFELLSVFFWAVAISVIINYTVKRSTI